MNGPTTVPWRVLTASTAAARLVIRFMTLRSSPTTSVAQVFHSSREETKKVVFPESPYASWRTRSSPSPAASACSTRSA